MQWVICKTIGLWRGDDPAECTGSFRTPWETPMHLVLSNSLGGGNSYDYSNHHVN